MRLNFVVWMKAKPQESSFLTATILIHQTNFDGIRAGLFSSQVSGVFFPFCMPLVEISNCHGVQPFVMARHGTHSALEPDPPLKNCEVGWYHIAITDSSSTGKAIFASDFVNCDEHRI